MIIKSLKDINNIKTMVRVMDSTYQHYGKTKSMIGEDLEVTNGAIGVYTKDKSNYWYFNKKDLQILTQVEYKGRLVGRGDEVLYDGEWFEVYGYQWDDDEFVLNTAKEKDYSNCYGIKAEDIEDIRPLYQPKPEEIITVGEYRYQLIQE